MFAAVTATEVQKKGRKWKMRTKPWILQRPVAGAYNVLIMDLFNTDEISYKFPGMDAGAVQELFSKMEVNRGVTFVQQAQLMLTTGSTRLAVSRGQQTWYHSTCYI